MCPSAEVNDPCKLPKAPLINIKARHPVRRVAIDIVGPTPRSISGHEWLLAVSDHLAKFAQAFPVGNVSAKTFYLKQCFSPPEIQENPLQLTSASHAEDTPQADNLRDGQPSPGTLVVSGDVELEWLESPVATVTGVSHPFQGRESSSESSGTSSTSPQSADLLCQSEVSQVSHEPRREPCHTPKRLRREEREPVWPRDC